MRFALVLGAAGGDICNEKMGGGMDWDAEVDCIGLLCPLPVLRAQKMLRGMQSGAVLRVLASDAMAAIDLPHFCDQAGHVYLGANAVPGGAAYRIQRG